MNTAAILAILNNNYSIRFNQMELYRDGGSLSYIVFGNGKKYFLKIIRPVFIETAVQSIDLQLYLAKNNVPVPNIFFSKYMKPYVETFETDRKYLYILYEYIEGQEPDINIYAKDIGSLIGKYHKAMQSYNGKLSIRDKYFFIGRYIEILRKMQYPENKVIAFEKHGDHLWEKVNDLPRGYCHGDLYIGNILQTQRGELYVTDFDTSCYAFPVYDIALVCNSTNYFNFDKYGFQKTKEMVEPFLLGYQQFCTINDTERNSIFFFIAIYHYQLQATIIEINGLNCVDESFLDRQYDWLMKWADECNNLGI
ncbi:MAG: phosphotransferase [Clostridia bacterium]